MAEKVHMPNPSASYDRDRRMYTASVAYQVNAHPAESITDCAISDTGIPNSLSASQFDIPDVELPNTATITMVAVGRMARQISAYKDTDGLPLTQVVVEYEGHFVGEGDGVGFVSSRPMFSTEMNEIVQSYDTSGGDYIGIGPQNEGTNRVEPGVIWELTYNVTDAADTGWQYNTWFGTLLALIGKVNEEGWAPNKEGLLRWTYGGGVPAGQLLMLAPNVLWNRDDTFTVTIRLQHSESPYYHQHKWRHYLDAPTDVTIAGETVERLQRKWGDQQASTIYETATDPLFRHLNL